MQGPVRYIDTNNLRIITAKRQNLVRIVSPPGESVRVRGTSEEYQTGSFVVLLDSTGRFMAGTPVQADESWELRFSFDCLAKDLGALSGDLYVVRSDDNTAVPVSMAPELRIELNKCINVLLPDDAQAVPSFHDRYVELIVEATKQRYVSTSIYDNIKTGNNYQSVDFGRTLRKGARPLRRAFLERVDFKGATVLDLGSNTGEVSRDIRQLGASLVDGYEYDPFFVETGRAMNAALGMTRVSLFQGDVATRELYEGMQYDIVVALAVYVYIVNRLSEIASVTDFLIFETHTLDHGLGLYLNKLRPHFPFVRHLGFSENNKDPRKSRAFLVFATSKDRIATRVADRRLMVKPYFRNRFLEECGVISPVNFLDFCQDLKVRSSGRRVGDAQPLSYGTPEYFTTFLLGYLDYLAANRAVQADNTFLKHYRKSIEDQTIDPALTPLLQDDGALAAKVRNKFADVEFFANGEPDLVPPITIVPAERGKQEFITTDGRILTCENIDGHHRFFMAQLLGYQTIPYEVAGGNARSWKKIVEANYTLTL